MIPAGAQAPATTVEIPQQLTQAEVRDLVARLSDAEVRQLIISQLDKQAQAQAQPADADEYVSQLHTGIEIAWSAISRMFASGSKIYDLPATILQALTDDGRISSAYLLFQLLGILIIGWLAALVARWFLSRSSAATRAPENFQKRFERVCYDLLQGLVGLAAFGAGSALFVVITSQQMPVAKTFWFEVIWCLVLIRLVVLAAKLVMAPVAAKSNAVPDSTNPVQQVLAWSMLLSASIILPQPLIMIATDHGADTDTLLLMSVIFGALFIALLIILMIRLRHYGAELIIGKSTSVGSLRLALARVWWLLSILYVLAIWFMSVGKRAATGESSLLPGLGSLFLFALVPFLDRGLQWLVTWYFRDKPEFDATSTVPADTSTEPMAIADLPENNPDAGHYEAPVYIATALRYARIIMGLVILLVFVRLWNINLEAITAQLIGPTFASALFDISITVLVTWALWGIIRISIERKLEEGNPANDEEGESEAGGLGGSRVETILPLIRICIKMTLVVMAVLISLSSLGVNIGPLIAGAGVVGIAIGFGAQTLVRDIVSGFFYLLDDAFRIGEYVVVENIRGTVEKISIRSFQLRHHEGPVHTVPYGEIRSLTNWSRDWAIMKFELRIPFETDIDVVRKIIKQIGIEMMQDDVFGPLLLAPLKSQGVNRMDDSALIIRCKFTAIPGQQYLIRREAFTRIQRVFEAKGIQFAPRRVLVEATTPAEAVKAAAGVLDQEKPEDTSKPPPM